MIIITKQQGKSAFSLIELMVVIAIVAILAAVAVPLYKRHLITARLISGATSLSDIMDRSISYANVHGHFGNACELGLNTNTNINCGVVENPNQINQYFRYMEISDESPNYCGATGFIYADISATVFGLPEEQNLVVGSGWGAIVCEYWHSNGIIHNSCYFNYLDPSDLTGNTYGTDNILPGWLNECLDSGCNTNNLSIASYNPSSDFYQATCQ